MNEQPPWGQKKRPSSPEDFLAALIRKIRDSFNEKQTPPGPNDNEEQPSGEGPGMFAGLGKVVLIISAVFLFQVIYSSFYTIQPGEVGVLLRFGQYTRTTEPGLHFKIPFIEELNKVNVEAVRKEEFGFRTRSPGKSPNYNRRGFDMEALMLTGDKNVIEVAWIVQYIVSDPVNFLFKVRNVSQAVRDASEMVTRRIVGNMDFDYVLSNREILAADAKKELQGELNTLECGVNIVTLQLQDINPPEKVKPAFNEVNVADQDMKRLVNEAEETYNRVIPKARGSAKQTVEEARGYAIERINRAKGETNRFSAILKEYQAAEGVTRQRMYLEAMQDILPHVDKVYVMDKSQQAVIPFLDLTGKGRNSATQKTQ
ncbi:FtsH protease activity modulator HflK [Desulfogranum mediterraneum]|uniref:FtsH protease activity modulator HflK n=1 Tax=Desulfogranum mediterraneum TaxID=160661 RepID=UPI000424A32A|nr:FtsH protease activity modulator HflK [Desulfogranum mediterraneum]